MKHMRVEFEIVHPDEGSSFRLLHQKTIAERHAWQYHYHPEYEIVCVLSGSGTRHVGNHFSSYDDGDLVIMGPNLPHAGFGLNAHGLHEEIVIQIKEDVFNQSLLTRPELGPLTPFLERVKYGVSFNGATREKATKKLIRLLKLPPFDRFIELIALLQYLATSTDYTMLNLPQGFLPLTVQKHHERLKSIFSYVEQHYDEEIEIKKVADVAHLTVPAFCNYFKKIMNITFTDFINQYRIQQACILLQQEKSIADACFECGFNNVTYFNKVFKAIMKKTPSEFKKAK
jgi:AraC-like DNA-binding protein/quercetin dioxygenase-like cupin family protein